MLKFKVIGLGLWLNWYLELSILREMIKKNYNLNNNNNNNKLTNLCSFVFSSFVLIQWIVKRQFKTSTSGLGITQPHFKRLNLHHKKPESGQNPFCFFI